MIVRLYSLRSRCFETILSRPSLQGLSEQGRADLARDHSGPCQRSRSFTYPHVSEFFRPLGELRRRSARSSGAAKHVDERTLPPLMTDFAHLAGCPARPTSRGANVGELFGHLVRLVCDEWGRCWRTGPRYDRYGYYGPRRYYGPGYGYYGGPYGYYGGPGVAVGIPGFGFRFGF